MGGGRGAGLFYAAKVCVHPQRWFVTHGCATTTATADEEAPVSAPMAVGLSEKTLKYMTER